MSENTTTDAPADQDAAPVVGEGAESGGNAEAARYRVKLRETEAQRDGLQAQLVAQHRAVIEFAATEAKVPLELLDDAKIPFDAIVNPDTGVADLEAARQWANAMAVRYGVQRGRQPNPGQGAGGGAVAHSGLDGMAAAFRADGAGAGTQRF